MRRAVCPVVILVASLLAGGCAGRSDGPFYVAVGRYDLHRSTSTQRDCDKTDVIPHPSHASCNDPVFLAAVVRPPDGRADRPADGERRGYVDRT